MSGTLTTDKTVFTGYIFFSGFQKVTRSRAEASSTTVTSVSEGIQRCEEVMQNLKASSSKLL